MWPELIRIIFKFKKAEVLWKGKVFFSGIGKVFLTFSLVLQKYACIMWSLRESVRDLDKKGDSSVEVRQTFFSYWIAKVRMKKQ